MKLKFKIYKHIGNYGKGVTITAGEMKALQELIKDKVVF